MILGLAVACGDDTSATEETDSGTSSATDQPSTSSSGDTEADGSSSSSSGEPITFCEGPTSLLYSPSAQRLDAFPDDVFTEDADTPTGLRMNLVPGDNVILGGAIAAFGTVFEQANTLDGFGTTAGFYFTFNRPIDPSTLPPNAPDAATASDSLVMIDLDADPPALVPFEYSITAENPGEPLTTLVLEPMAPLQPAHRHGVALTQRVRAEDGDCIAPSESMLSLLQGEAVAPLDRVQGGVDALVAALVDAGTIAVVEELSAAVVFTTQTTVDEVATIAEEIRTTGSPTYLPDEIACEEPEKDAPYRVCRGTIDVLDYTNEDEVVTADLSTTGSYDLPVVVFLPLTGTAPYPTILYGHGLGGTRDQAAFLGELFGPDGMAVIAVDAPKHGDHPDGGDDAVLDFFGLSLNIADPLDALQLRDNFRQGSFDRLQVVQAVLSGIDADDDGTVDLNAGAMHYLGVSLGGIMAPGVLAFAPEFRTATLLVPGARSTSIVRDGSSFSSLLGVFAQAATDGELVRFFPVVQSVIDRGDAGVYAQYVLPGRRLQGFDESAPSVLGQMVIDDTTVPNSTNRFFTRAMGLPHVGNALQPIGVVPHEPELPTAANFDAEHTAGMFQFDVIEGGGMATHSGIAVSEVGQLQIHRFVTSEAAGAPEILDPYVELE